MLDVWIVRLRIWSPGCWGCVLAPHDSPTTEYVWFFSCTTKIRILVFPVFGYSPLQLPVCLALMAHGWAGLVWFIAVQMCPGFA